MYSVGGSDIVNGIPGRLQSALRVTKPAWKRRSEGIFHLSIDIICMQDLGFIQLHNVFTVLLVAVIVGVFDYKCMFKAAACS